MSFANGTQLGPYEIVAPIGAGGMAEVYKARDTRLDRVVAIKVAKENFSERFEREARAVAALNHPNICTLHDVGPNYLVMEYLEGAPLNGPIPLAQALRYAMQICDALDAAHRKSIIHRDLKPGNILITRTGVKVLDFGLAKIREAVQMDEATLTNAITGKGEILGTLNYMSPEQLQGLEAGAPSDIFSFGLVLYEMLTGKRAFEGSSPASVIAATLERPSPSIADIAPPELDRVLHRCLQKDSGSRWQSARDLKAELEWIAESPASVAKTSRTPHPQILGRMGWIVAAVLALGLAFTLSPFWRPAPEPAAIMFELSPPEGEFFSGGFPMISPNGELIAALVGDGTARRRIAVRHLNAVTWQKLPGTENAGGVTWSPDNRYLAFVSGSAVKKVDVTGGPPQSLADFPGGWIPYLAWNRDGAILFSRRDGLWKVMASGGNATQVTAYDASLQEDLHGVPQFLPDGRHFLFIARSSLAGKSSIYAGSIEGSGDKNRTFIMPASTSVLFNRSAQGAEYILFEREGALMAQPFDAAHLKLTGDPFLASPQVGLAGTAVAASVSAAGALVLSRGPDALRGTQLAWFGRNGKLLSEVGPVGIYSDFALSPDRKRLMVSHLDDGDLYLIDLATSGQSRFTFDPASDRFGVWSPDNTRIVYARSLAYVYEKPISGSGEHQLTGVLGTPSDWSRDGHSILVRGNDGDLWALIDGKPFRITETQFTEGQAQFSPDGKWIAFVSDESKRNEVYVQAFPKPGEKFPISIAGGVQPRWAGDGKELFYIALDGKLMAVRINTHAGFEHAAPTPLFDVAQLTNNAVGFDYLVDGSGPRFLVRTPAKGSKASPVTVITDWLAVAKKPGT
jgi:serine/threonine protein kinase/Tol biopolymer transport system component